MGPRSGELRQRAQPVATYLSIGQRARAARVRRFIPPRSPSASAATYTADTAAQVANNSVRAGVYRVLYIRRAAPEP